MRLVLSSTNQLSSLEITNGKASMTTSTRQATKLNVYIDCLSNLRNSISSLRHLRLIALSPHPEIQTSVFQMSLFGNLSILGLEGHILQDLLSRKSSPILSSSVEILQLLFYQLINDHPHVLKEEMRLSDLLDTDVFPNVEQVFVPLRPSTGETQDLPPPQLLKGWKKSREVLENNQQIKAGEVKFLPFKLGETSELSCKRKSGLGKTKSSALTKVCVLVIPSVGEASKGEDCISVWHMLSPFPI